MADSELARRLSLLRDSVEAAFPDLVREPGAVQATWYQELQLLAELAQLEPALGPVYYRKGEPVLTSRGRVGLVARFRPYVQTGDRYIVVQFGTDGPFGTYSGRNLRYATPSEVELGGLDGVGLREPAFWAKVKRHRRKRCVQ